MILLGWILFSCLVVTIVAKHAVAKHEAANRWSQPGYQDLLAEHEACVTEEECLEAEDETDEYHDNYDAPYEDEPYEDEYEEPYEEHPYGYRELYADDPEPYYAEDTYDTNTDCDDYRREVTDDERW